MTPPRCVADSAAARKRYAALCAITPHATAFHGLPWLRVLERCGVELCFVESGDAMIPFALQGRGSTRRAFSLPYDTPAGPVGDDGVGWSFRSVGDALRCPSVRIVDASGAVAVDGAATQPMQSHRIDLAGGAEAVRQNFSRSARKAIRQAIDRGVTVSVRADPDVADAFYSRYCGLMQAHGARRFPRTLVEAITGEMVPQGAARFYEAQVDGTTAAVMIVLRGAREAVAWSIGYDPGFQGARPNNALVDRWIQDEIDEGTPVLDLGASPGGEASRVDRFKESFGATPVSRVVLYREALSYRILRRANRALGR